MKNIRNELTHRQLENKIFNSHDRCAFLGGAAAAAAKSLQSCPTLCDPIDSSPPGSSVPGILQAKNTGVGYGNLLQYSCLENRRDGGAW